MTDLTVQFFKDQSGTVDGNDSRTQGDENLNALANSLSNQCPNWDGQITATPADVNLATRRDGSYTISGTWSFSNVTTFTAGPPILLDLAANQTISKTGAGELRLNTENGAVVLRPDGVAAVTANPNDVTVTPSLTAQDTIAAVGSITTDGSVTAQGKVTAVNDVSVGDELQLQATGVLVDIAQAQGTVGSGTEIEAIRVRLWDGTIGHIKVYSGS